jgi:hypothetical protein
MNKTPFIVVPILLSVMCFLLFMVMVLPHWTEWLFATMLSISAIAWYTWFADLLHRHKDPRP